MTRWCDDCKHKDTCERYKEEMKTPMSKFFQGCLGGYEQADMRGNTKRKGTPIEGNNESYNCENWIP